MQLARDRARWIVTGLLLGVASDAFAAGAGGAFFETQYIPRYGPRSSPHEAPGLVGCIGGVGYGTTKRGVRIGGEGGWCTGSDGDVQLGFAGAQLGTWHKTAWPYFSFYGALGLGGMTDRKVLEFQDAPYRSFYFYARPTAAMGLPLGFVAAELGVYVNLPFNLAQWVGDGAQRGFVTPTVGASVSVLFGNFQKPKNDEASRSRYPPPPPPPNTPTLLDPPRRPSETIPEVPDCSRYDEECASERPLAIPAW